MPAETRVIRSALISFRVRLSVAFQSPLSRSNGESGLDPAPLGGPAAVTPLIGGGRSAGGGDGLEVGLRSLRSRLKITLNKKMRERNLMSPVMGTPYPTF